MFALLAHIRIITLKSAENVYHLEVHNIMNVLKIKK